MFYIVICSFYCKSFWAWCIQLISSFYCKILHNERFLKGGLWESDNHYQEHRISLKWLSSFFTHMAVRGHGHCLSWVKDEVIECTLGNIGYYLYYMLKYTTFFRNRQPVCLPRRSWRAEMQCLHTASDIRAGRGLLGPYNTSNYGQKMNTFRTGILK